MQQQPEVRLVTLAWLDAVAGYLGAVPSGSVPGGQLVQIVDGLREFRAQPDPRSQQAQDAPTEPVEQPKAATVPAGGRASAAFSAHAKPKRSRSRKPKDKPIACT